MPKTRLSHNLVDQWKRFFSTTIVYYFLAGLIVFFSVDVQKARVNRLNGLQELAAYPARYLDHQVPFQERPFRTARKYYQTLIDLIPDYEKKGLVDGPVTLSRAYAMMALCDYYLGKNKEAVELFKKALEIEPRHFWFSYNLGVIYFQLGDYETALPYLKDFFSFNTEKLDVSVNLDSYAFWAPKVAQNYKKVSLAKFYEVTVHSYKLAVLAYERLKKPAGMKALSVMAIQSGLANQDQFFYYYAGLTSQRPEVGRELFDLMVHPLVYFVPIGKERYFVQRR